MRREWDVAHRAGSCLASGTSPSLHEFNLSVTIGLSSDTIGGMWKGPLLPRTRDPELPRRLEEARAHDLEYLLIDSLERLGAHRTELVAEMQTFWRDRF